MYPPPLFTQDKQYLGNQLIYICVVSGYKGEAGKLLEWNEPETSGGFGQQRKNDPKLCRHWNLVCRQNKNSPTWSGINTSRTRSSQGNVSKTGYCVNRIIIIRQCDDDDDDDDNDDDDDDDDDAWWKSPFTWPGSTLFVVLYLLRWYLSVVCWNEWKQIM